MDFSSQRSSNHGVHHQTHIDLKARFRGLLNTIAATPLTLALMLAVSAATTARGVTFERSISLSHTGLCNGRVGTGNLPAFPQSWGELTSVSIRITGWYSGNVNWENRGTEINAMELTVRPSSWIDGFDSYNPIFPQWGASVSMEKQLSRTLQPNENSQDSVSLERTAIIPVGNLNAFYSDQLIRGYSFTPTEISGTLILRQSGEGGVAYLNGYCLPRLSAWVLYEYQPPGAIPEAEEYGLAFSALLLISAVSRSVLRR